MRRRDIDVARSTAWALARNEAAALDSNGYTYCPTSPAWDTGDRVECSGDELFGSDKCRFCFIVAVVSSS